MFQSLANRNWLVKRIKNGRKASVSRCGTRHFPYRKVAQRGDARCDAADAADVQFPYRIDEFRQMVVSAIDQPFLSLSLFLSSFPHRFIPAGICNGPFPYFHWSNSIHPNLGHSGIHYFGHFKSEYQPFHSVAVLSSNLTNHWVKSRALDRVAIHLFFKSASLRC